MKRLASISKPLNLIHKRRKSQFHIDSYELLLHSPEYLLNYKTVITKITIVEFNSNLKFQIGIRHWKGWDRNMEK